MDPNAKQVSLDFRADTPGGPVRLPTTHPGQEPLSPIALSTSWQRLTLRQKIGQTMIMLPNRQLEQELGNGAWQRCLERYPVSGFFIGWKLFDGVEEAAKRSHTIEWIKAYQAASAVPLIFQQDYESGVSLPGMTSFPHPMALGATQSPQLAYDLGRSIAREARSVGVQWVLHPVADLNLNPFNPIANVRSVSDNPDTTIRLLRQQILGLRENGVAATIKHFPGDGVDYRDQHLLTSCNSLPRESWNEYHGRVFQALIDSGVDAVMPGHISLPAFQRERVNGLALPATLSRELLTDLLKGEMRFRGVIVSDALTMGGFRGWHPTQLESEIQTFIAGTDVMLWPSYEYMDELERRIEAGTVPVKRLDDAVSRIWALKERLGLLQENRPLFRDITEEERSLAVTTARRISESAVTLVRDRQHALPLKPAKSGKILVVGIAPISKKGGQGGLEKLRHFQALLAARGFQVDYQHNVLYETQGWQESVTAEYDVVICVVIRTPHSPFGPLGLYDDEAQSVWAINAMPKDKVVVISLGCPYVGNQYFERVNTYINAYSNDPTTHEAVVGALMGDIPFRGVSPVNLEPPHFQFR